MNSAIRDNFLSFGGPWTPYTPSWTATTTNPSIGNGAFAFRYARAGSTFMVTMEQVWGSTTSNGSGTYRWSLPLAHRTIGDAYMGLGGWVYMEDLAAAAYSLFPRVVRNQPTLFGLVGHQASGSPVLGFEVTNTVPFTPSAGDYIRGNFIYESAI